MTLQHFPAYGACPASYLHNTLINVVSFDDGFIGKNPSKLEEISKLWGNYVDSEYLSTLFLSDILTDTRFKLLTVHIEHLEELGLVLKKSDGEYVVIRDHKVHNHGPEDGPGLNCVEKMVDNKIRGMCMTPSSDSTKASYFQEVEVKELPLPAYGVKGMKWGKPKKPLSVNVYIQQISEDELSSLLTFVRDSRLSLSITIDRTSKAPDDEN